MHHSVRASSHITVINYPHVSPQLPYKGLVDLSVPNYDEKEEPTFTCSQVFSGLFQRARSAKRHHSVSEMATNTSNHTNPTRFKCDPRHSTSAVAALTACYCAITAALVVGNSLIIVVLRKNKSMRKTVNWFLLNIAVVNLLLPFAFISHEVTSLVTRSMVWRVDGLAGTITCKILGGFLPDVVVWVSTFGVVLISFERFLAIVFPLRASAISNRYRCTLLVSSWLLASGLASPQLYTFKIDAEGYCIHNWQPADERGPERDKLYRTIVTVIVILTPMALLCFFYSCILISIRRKKSTAEELNRDQRMLRARENSRVTRTVIAIVGAFAICYLPSSVLQMNQIFWHNAVMFDFNSCGIVAFLYSAKILICLNGVLHPLICFVFLEAYRNSLKRLFCSTDLQQDPHAHNTETLRLEMTTDNHEN